jgi:hypothetical protein
MRICFIRHENVVEVPTKYPPSQNDRIVVFETRLHSETQCSTDQRSMATEML